MKRKLLAGTTSLKLRIFVQDSSKTDGSGLAGLTSASAGLTWYYCRNGDTSATAVTLASGTLGTYASGGFVAVDGTNMPGVYEIGVPNAAIASGSDTVHMMLKGATNMVPVLIEIELDAVNYQDATAFGLSRLDAAISSRMATFTVPTNFAALAITAGGAVTAGTVSDKTGYSLTQAFPSNFASLAITAGGIVSADLQTIKAQSVTCAAGVTVNANLGTTQPINFTGTAASALVKSDMQDIAGAAVSTSAAQIGVNVVNIKGTASAGQAGYVGADWGAIANKATANVLSGTTIGNVVVGGYAAGQDPATLVLDVAIAGHEGAGSVGAAIAAAGGSGDPWATALPGSYAAGTAGYIVGHNLDAAISTRSTFAGGSVASVTGNVGGNVVGSVGSISGVSFPTNFGSLAIDTGGHVKLQGTIQKNTALAGFPFFMALSSDHYSPATGKTITATRSLDGAAFAACANAATEIGNGWYQISLAAADTDGNTVALSLAATGCDNTLITLTTQP